jgi:hypothetical protein
VEAYVLALDAYAFHPAEADASADAADASGTQAA